MLKHHPPDIFELRLQAEPREFLPLPEPLVLPWPDCLYWPDDAAHGALAGRYSVMIDGSHLPYDENVALTKKVVEYAHQFDVTVEGELGVLAGVEDEVSSDHHTYTEPDEVVDFVTKTGCDSLAISIGARHDAAAKVGGG